MSQIQLIVVKSFRVSFCEPPPNKKFFGGIPKCPGKVCLKFPSQFRQASFPNSAVCIDSLLALDGKLQTYLSRAFWGTIKKCFLEVAHNG